MPHWIKAFVLSTIIDCLSPLASSKSCTHPSITPVLITSPNTKENLVFIQGDRKRYFEERVLRKVSREERVSEVGVKVERVADLEKLGGETTSCL